DRSQELALTSACDMVRELNRERCVCAEREATSRLERLAQLVAVGRYGRHNVPSQFAGSELFDLRLQRASQFGPEQSLEHERRNGATIGQSNHLRAPPFESRQQRQRTTARARSLREHGAIA